ncbi:hypothetical protein C0993_004575 [Termitomyces sp. T159_Od127]|nr:hypothetical protein C0993_004575 [Termitomyces sp. T159_Od127]
MTFSHISMPPAFDLGLARTPLLVFTSLLTSLKLALTYQVLLTTGAQSTGQVPYVVSTVSTDAEYWQEREA